MAQPDTAYPLRTYGVAPFWVAVLHGGPGAPGGMAPVARRLARGTQDPSGLRPVGTPGGGTQACGGVPGVLEPLQTASSLEGQLEELKSLLARFADLPVTLIGSSWGAMLGFIFTAYHPSFVRKLILVGSGVFDERYASTILETRLRRLDEEQQKVVESALAILSDPEAEDRPAAMRRLGAALTRADAYDPVTLETDVLEHQPEVFLRVWAEAQRLRASGQLLELGTRIRCPVVAIHGDHDPHPAEGVQTPLASVLTDFRFHLLEKCGHLPWIERQAQERFYALLEEELE